MGAPSFGSFGPAGPGFGSIQNAPAGGANPTAFPTAPPPAVGSGGLAPGGLGNMVGVNLQPQQPGPAQAAPQAFRAPLPQAPPPLQSSPQAAAPQSNPFANVQIPQGQNTQVAEPRGGLNFQQWNALTPQQQGSAEGPLLQYQAGRGMIPSGGSLSDPQAQMGLQLMNSAGTNWNQMFGSQSGSPQGQQAKPSLFGLGGL